MRLSRQKPPPGTPNVLAGEVWDIGYLGDWTVYRVELDDGSILRVSRANASRFVEPPDRLGRARPSHLRARRGDRS